MLGTFYCLLMNIIKTKNFGKTRVTLDVPYLLSIPEADWKGFWEVDLQELLEEASPITDYTGEKFKLEFLDYKLEKPKYATDLEAKRNNDSFDASLRVRVKLTNLRTKDIIEQEIFFADFPLMTERGTFIVNGVERVVISQLVRSPGAFFTSKMSRGKEMFGAKIIPNRGAWLEFETDSSGVIYVRIDRKRKIAATALLRAFGINDINSMKDLFNDVNKGEIDFIEETLKKDPSNNQAEALVEVYQRIRPGDRATADSAKELIDNMFFNFKRYDLSKVGRWRMRQRLDELKPKKAEEDIPLEERVLNVNDVISVMREIIRLNNNPLAVPDQIDHLGNRRVRTFSELLKNRLRVGLMRMERIIKDKMSIIDVEDIDFSILVNARPFAASIQQFFNSSQFSQFMDNENPLSELEQKRRLTSSGPGGLTRERAGFEVRDVQPSHYGRICPIQTPEGPNVGLVGHIASYAKINPFGFLETPYFKVTKGKVDGGKPFYLNAYEEEKHVISAGTVKIDKDFNIIPAKLEARVKGVPRLVSKDLVDFIDVSSEQFISVATSCIPFLQNDDANRALMGSNMQRQAVPLIEPDAPLVMTGMEEKISSDSGQSVVADFDGIIKEVDGAHIVLAGTDKKNRSKVYNLRTFIGTNQYTCLHQRPVVIKGEKVKKGDILANGGAIDKGHLALGKNLLVAFLPWRGCNYEDAIVISDRLVREDTLSSIHIERYNCDIRDTKLGVEMTTSDIPNVSEEKLKDLDEEGIIRIGAEVNPGDILVGKISPKGETDLTAEERLLRAIFGEKAREVKDTSLLMNHGKRGRVIGIKVFSRDEGHKLEPGVIKKVEVEIAQLRKIGAGDKLAGRHGNKGVISTVLAQEEMPFLEDGTPVDIVLNPLGVVSRMNIGQILETHLGMAAKKLGYHAITPSLSGATEDDIREELKKAGFPEDGKFTLYDGRTGKPFANRVMVGQIYMLKLIHMVQDKLHMRSIGDYSLITQQPLGGKAQFGGQRLGEMEVWALEGYGAANTLQEMLTVKSDDIQGRSAVYEAILKGKEISAPNLPASFNLLINEMKALGLNVIIKKKDGIEEEEEEEEEDYITAKPEEPKKEDVVDDIEEMIDEDVEEQIKKDIEKETKEVEEETEEKIKEK